MPGSTTGRGSEEAPARVTGFAELAVRRWLTTADNQVVASGQPIGTRSSAGPGAPPVVLGTHDVAARRLSERYWAVTVVAEMGRADGTPALRFIEIGIADTSDGLLAAGPPAVVPSPLGPGSVRPAGRTLTVAQPDDPITATAQAFVDALLAGRGDVSRYLAPGARLAAVTPAFDSVRVERTAEVTTTADRRVLRVEAVATEGGADYVLGYELTLEQRAGRWEIRRMSGAPTLRSIASGPTTATSTTSPTANPTTTAVAPAVPGA